MSPIAKDPEDETLEELLAEMRNAPTPGSSRYARVTTMIQIRLAELQATTSQDLESATKHLVGATRSLRVATWGLVVVTAVLVIVELILKLVFGKG